MNNMKNHPYERIYIKFNQLKLSRSFVIRIQESFNHGTKIKQIILKYNILVLYFKFLTQPSLSYTLLLLLTESPFSL